MQGNKEKGLQAVGGRQAGARQRVQRARSTSIPRFADSSQPAALKGDGLQIVRIEGVSKHYE